MALQKLYAERDEVREKRTNLITFITTSPTFRELDIGHRRMLNKQLNILTEYAGILTSRINLMEKI